MDNAVFSGYDPGSDPDQARLRHPVVYAYDLLLKGGHVIDPGSGLHARLDVAFSGGRVAAIEEEIPAQSAHQVLSAADSFVSPGWIDFHVHAYPGVSPLSVPADEYSLLRGVTTAVSAGDAGSATFEGFVRYIIQMSRTRLFGFVNICRTGLSGYPAGELRDLTLLDPYSAARTVEEYRDVCLGIKVRMTRFIVGDNGLEPLRRAIQAAELAKTRVMVHVYDIPGTFPELLSLLRPGDIVTHPYMGTENGILDETTQLLPAVIDARDRGILFDVGHGSKAGFSLPVAKRALEQGLMPDSISTDLHTQSVGTSMIDLANVMTKFLNLGMSLDDVLLRVTARPAAMINRVDALGSLRIGAPGDAVIFRVGNQIEAIEDDLGHRVPAQQKIAVLTTIRAGRIVGAPYSHPRS